MIDSGIISTNNLKHTPATLATFGSVTNICIGDADMSIVTEKRCGTCGKIKSLSEFPVEKRRKSGYSSRCLKCRNEYQRAYIEANREKVLENKRRWNKENPEKHRQHNKKYRNTHLEIVSAKDRIWKALNLDKIHAWYSANSASVKARNKKWHADNPDKAKQLRRNWMENNREKERANSRKWKSENPDKVREGLLVRRARKLGAGGKITANEWNALKELYSFTCLCCKRQEPEIKLTVDHVVPLSVGGTNTIDNAQPLCLSCNCSKGTKTIDYRGL